MERFEEEKPSSQFPNLREFEKIVKKKKKKLQGYPSKVTETQKCRKYRKSVAAAQERRSNEFRRWPLIQFTILPLFAHDFHVPSKQTQAK